MSSGLRLDMVTMRLYGEPLLSVDTVIPPGVVVTIMGASGSGKSSLLRYLVGALSPPFAASGRVLLDGVSLEGRGPEERQLGILFQDDLLFPHLSVGDNLLFAVPSGGTRAARTAKAVAALDEAGLSGFFDRDPATLSGGQRARVALLRVLLSRPRALLLDEPFSKLDAALRRQIRDYVFGEVRRRALPALLVTHDPEDAAAAGGPIIQLG